MSTVLRSILWIFSLIPFLFFQNCGRGFNAEIRENISLLSLQPQVELLPQPEEVGSTPNPLLSEKIAKAYIQAVTDNPDDSSKIVNDKANQGPIIDFKDCRSALVADLQTCERPVYNGKSGRAHFLQVVNEKNIFSFIPTVTVRRALSLNIIEKWLQFINGATVDAKESEKLSILRDYLRSFSDFGLRTSPSMILPTFFDGILETSVTDLSIDIKIEQFPKYHPIDLIYFWALTVAFTPAAGVSSWWGHVGVQITRNPKCGADDGRCANWGGGGKGDGTGDYGLGGSIVIPYRWEVGETYTYRILRKDQLQSGRWAGAWNWEAQIIRKKSGQVTSLGSILGGDSIVTEGIKKLGILPHEHNPHIMTEFGYGVLCTSPSVMVSWSALKINSVPFSGKAVAIGRDEPCSNTVQLDRVEIDEATRLQKKSILQGLNQVRLPGYQNRKDLNF